MDELEIIHPRTWKGSKWMILIHSSLRPGRQYDSCCDDSSDNFSQTPQSIPEDSSDVLLQEDASDHSSDDKPEDAKQVRRTRGDR